MMNGFHYLKNYIENENNNVLTKQFLLKYRNNNILVVNNNTNGCGTNRFEYSKL
jgi:hypothetical protein